MAEYQDSAKNRQKWAKYLHVAYTIKVLPGKSYRVGRLSTVDILVLTRLDQLIFSIENIIFLFTKQATLMRRSTVQSLRPELAFPCVKIVIYDHKGNAIYYNLQT